VKTTKEQRIELRIELVRSLTACRDDVLPILDDLDTLEEKLRIAKEALEEIHYMREVIPVKHLSVCNKAHDTLARIEEEGKG
jgi:hypothetical protein